MPLLRLEWFRRPLFTEGFSQRMHVYKTFPSSRRFFHTMFSNIWKQPFNFRFCNFPQVLSNQLSITGRVQPSSVSFETKQTTPCLLVLTSQGDASPGTVTQVNVTATPASHNADINHLSIFSLTVTTDGKLPVKNNDLENEDLGKEKKLEKWQLSSIIGAVTFTILLVTILLICGVNSDSKNKVIPVRISTVANNKKRAMKCINGNHGGRN